MLVVLLDKGQSPVNAVVKEATEMLAPRFGDLSRQTLDPSLHIRPPTQVNRILHTNVTEFKIHGEEGHWKKMDADHIHHGTSADCSWTGL